MSIVIELTLEEYAHCAALADRDNEVLSAWAKGWILEASCEEYFVSPSERRDAICAAHN
jgi:hypothetical protein